MSEILQDEGTVALAENAEVARQLRATAKPARRWCIAGHLIPIAMETLLWRMGKAGQLNMLVAMMSATPASTPLSKPPGHRRV